VGKLGDGVENWVEKLAITWPLKWPPVPESNISMRIVFSPRAAFVPGSKIFTPTPFGTPLKRFFVLSNNFPFERSRPFLILISIKNRFSRVPFN